MAVAHPVTHPAQYRRTQPRMTIKRPCALRFRGLDFDYDGTCIDISTLGAGVILDRAPWLVNMSGHVILTLRGHAPLNATFRWSNGARIGLIFGPDAGSRTRLVDILALLNPSG